MEFPHILLSRQVHFHSVCSIYLESQEKSGFVGRQVKLFAAHLIAIQGIGGRNGTDLK